LADREHEHAGIVRAVHVVREPVAVRAVATANARESGALVVATSRIGGVANLVASVAPRPVVAPDVEEVQPVANLVGGGSTPVKRRRSRPVPCPKGLCTQVLRRGFIWSSVAESCIALVNGHERTGLRDDLSSAAWLGRTRTG